MWDGVANYQKWWSGLGQTRILSFAWILHDVRKTPQFFPDPSGFSSRRFFDYAESLAETPLSWRLPPSAPRDFPP